MKTRFKTLTDPKKANEKRRNFEEKTGLKWDWYPTGDGIIFTPIVTHETPVISKNARIIENLLTGDSIDFVTLADKAHLPLGDVLGIARYLVLTEAAWPEVNRHGKFAGLRKRIP